MGGGERYPVELASAMARKVPTRLVAYAAGPLKPHPSLPCETVVLHDLSWRDKGNPLPWNLTFYLRDADVIHCHHYHFWVSNLCLLYGRLTGKKVFVTDHGGRARNLGQQFDLSRFAHRFLAVSDYAIAQLDGGKYRNKSTVIHGGVDAKKFHPDSGPRRGIVYVGRFLPGKGIDRLVEALPPSAELDIVGSVGHPAYFDRIRNLAQGKQVRFHLNVSQTALREFFRKAMVAVSASQLVDCYGNQGWGELFPLVVLEGMASGCAMVVTAAGGAVEAVRHNVEGLVVPPGDTPALREALGFLLNHPAEAHRMGDAARQRVLEYFTWDKVAERCLAAYPASFAQPHAKQGIQ